MPTDSAYVAFPASARLKDNALRLVQNLESGAAAPQGELLTQVVDDLTRDILQVFMLDLTDLLNLPPLLSRLIHATVSTISTTASNIIRAIAKKLGNPELTPLAAYVRGLMLHAPDEAGHSVAWIGFPLDDGERRRTQTLITSLRGNNPAAHAPELVAILGMVTDRAVQTYVHEPADLLRLGFILRKIVDGGAAVIRTASHAMVRKMVPDLDAPQLLALADHLDRLLLINPAAGPG